MSRQALQRKLFEKNQKKQTMMSLNPLDGGGLNGLNLLHREPLGSIVSHAGGGNSNTGSSSYSSSNSSMRGGMGVNSGSYGASGGSFIDEEEEEEEDNMNQKYRDNKMSAINIGR
jgi:hypothetical protein